MGHTQSKWTAATLLLLASQMLGPWQHPACLTDDILQPTLPIWLVAPARSPSPTDTGTYLATIAFTTDSAGGTLALAHTCALRLSSGGRSLCTPLLE